MRADPHPHDSVRGVDPECAVMDAYADRPEVADALEVQGGMAWVGAKQIVVLIGNLSDIRWKCLV
jgi:hypothetical protein